MTKNDGTGLDVCRNRSNDLWIATFVAFNEIDIHTYAGVTILQKLLFVQTIKWDDFFQFIYKEFPEMIL